MKFTALTYLCFECSELFERAPKGTCPTCSSHNVYPLSAQLQSPKERIAWLRRIHGNQFTVVLRPLMRKEEEQCQA